MMKNNMGIIWKDIKGFEGIYKISNLGEILSLKQGRERILKKKYNLGGYLYIGLCKNGKRTMLLVHRILAEAFIEKQEGRDFINHKNSIRDDNRIENLERCTIQENVLHGFREGGRIHPRPDLGKFGILNKASKKIDKFSLDGKFIKTLFGMHEAGRDVNGSYKNISACCRGKRKSSYGFIWKYNLG